MRRYSGMLSAGALLLCLALGSGCASSREVAEQTAEPEKMVVSRLPVSSYLGGSDPLEGFNRTVFYGVDFFYYYIYRPVGYIYGSIMPRYGVEMINNATDNVEFPRRFLSSLLQGRFSWAGTEFLRFLCNSTIGIAGLFDPARHWFDLHAHNEDFGQAFAAWGIGNGFVLQLAGPSNLRDGIGMIFDYAADIKSYFYGGQAFTFLNRGMDPFGQYDMLRQSTFDSYQALKDYQLMTRYLQVHNWQCPPVEVNLDEKGQLSDRGAANDKRSDQTVILEDYYPQQLEIDTLRSAWLRPSYDSFWTRLSFFNHDFVNSAEVRNVQIANDREVSYRYWLCGKPGAGLVVILPGLGGFNNALTTQALAELCVNKQLNVVSISNNMTWEFAEAFDVPPGYTPADAAKLEEILQKVLIDLQQHEQSVAVDKPMLLGYSQGALNALFLLDRQRKGISKLAYQKVLAINPPVDLWRSLTVLDDFMRSMDDRPLEDAVQQLLDGAGSFMYAVKTPAIVRRRYIVKPGAQSTEPRIDQVPIQQMVARVLIAYSFKRSLDDLLVAMHHQKPVPGIATPYRWADRQSLYDELAGWNFQHYCRTVLLPYYAAEDADMTLEKLNASAGLAAVESTLRQAENLLVLHSEDDFLLNQADRDFLRNTLQNRLVMFSHGSHLGNLYTPQVQNVIADYLTGAQQKQQKQ